MLNNKVYLLQRYLTVNNFLYPTLIVLNESFCYCKTKLQMCKLWFMWICVFNIYVLLISFIYYCKTKFSIYMLQISIVLWILLYFKCHPHYEIFRKKSKIIDRNTISYLQIKFIFEFCEWSTRQVLKNTQFLETTKLSITFMTIISFSNWARNELENFDHILHVWKKLPPDNKDCL